MLCARRLRTVDKRHFRLIQSRNVAVAASFHRQSPKAVVFDLGGVITSSPFTLFRQVENEQNLRERSIQDTIKAAGTNGSFSQLERGEITVAEFPSLFAAEYQQQWDVVLTPSVVEELMCRLKQEMTTPHQEVLDAARMLSGHDIKVAILTNNFKEKDGTTWLPPELTEVFDKVSTCVRRLYL